MLVHITRATRIFLFWSLIAIAFAISAMRMLLAELDDYLPEVEQKVREITEMPLRIGHLGAGMRGFNPEVILKEIHLDSGDPSQPPDIRLREIRLGIEFWDLILSHDLLSASRVTLVGADVSVLRKEDGSLSIKGLPATDEQPLWLLRGGKYEILDSQITWQDQKRHGEPVHFDHFDLVLKNHYSDGSHEMHLLSPLPEQYGDSLRISARITGNVFQTDDIDGQLYIEGNDLQVTALVTGDLPLGLNFQSGAGDIRVWSLWRNSKPYQVDGYVQAQQISINKDQAPPQRMDTFQASFSWSDNDGRWRLAGYDVNIFANRHFWPDGAFYLQQDAQGNLSAIVKQLDLPAAMLLAPLIMPTEHDYAGWLKLNPSGRLRDVKIFVGHDLQNYAVHGQVDDLSVDSFQMVPQIRHLSGLINANNRYGRIDLDTVDASANVSDLFRNTIDIKRLQGNIHWWQDDQAWQFFSRNLKADSADFQTVSSLNLLVPKNEASPVLDMRTRFGAFVDISQAYKYLPAKIMNEGAVAWLDDAFIAGQVRRGEMVIQGALDQFPFENGDGRFETVFTIEHGELQFNEEWPHLRDLHADVQFLANDLKVGILEGRSERVSIDQAMVTIPELSDSENVFVWGQVHSDIMSSLAFLQKSPLKPKIDPIADLLTAKGEANVDLELKIPYDLNKTVAVDVNAHLNGAQLMLKPVDLKVDGVKGILKFTEDSVSSGPIQAKSLGYPIKGYLSSDDHATYLTIDGKTDIEKLETQFPFLQNDAAEGSFPYRAKLTLPYGEQSLAYLNIDSGLQGLTIGGQAGLAKSAEEEAPLSLEFDLDKNAYLPLQLRYGGELQAFFLIDKNQEKLHSGHVVFGEGNASRYDNAGLKIDIRRPNFDLSQAVAAFSSGDRSSWPPLKEIDIDTQTLVWKGHELGRLNCRLQHAERNWHGYVDSMMAKGRFQIPDEWSGNQRMKLDMDFINVSAMDHFEMDETNDAVTDLPLIDIDSSQLWWRSVDLGRLRLRTERLIDGIHFKKIQVAGKNADIELTANWLKQSAGGTRTQMKGSLNTGAFGALLSKLGVSDDIKETSAKIDFNGEWEGGPHQFSMEGLTGQLQLDLQDGSISSIEPGFGRLLGLIAMEQWVKRLSLDFSDLYREGLAFDDIYGRIKIKNGLAFTDDLTVDAVAATFKIAGYVNLIDKTLDQRVAVLPKSSGAVPIAGTIVGGIASIITQVVTDDYKEGYFFGSKYQLSGAWGNVEVTPLHEEDGLINKTWRGLTDFGWLNSDTQ
ncbi:MAG: YhdP family protein [Gammaproteobacteria bacterium]